MNIHPIVKGLMVLENKAMKKYPHYIKILNHAKNQAGWIHAGELNLAAGLKCSGITQCKNYKCEHAKVHKKTKACRSVWAACKNPDYYGGCRTVRK